jgi:hypothetical protein
MPHPKRHDWQTQKSETFSTFRDGTRGVKVPAEAVVVFFFLAEEISPNWAEAEKALRARGFKTRHDADQIEARTPGPIPVTAEAIWDWEKAGTEELLPFDFWPDGWEIED